MKVGINKENQPGDEYSYTYVTRPSNEKLLFSYGFYIENNDFSTTMLRSTLNKPQINREKHNLIVKLKLLDQAFDGFFNSNHQSLALLQLIDKHSINEKVLNVFRIYFYKNNMFNPSLIERRLASGQLLNFENELLSLIYFRGVIEKSHLGEAKLTLPDIIQSLEITNKYYQNNKNIIEHDYSLNRKYLIRSKLMEVIRESVGILQKNIIYADEKLQDLLSDQMVKLKSYYVDEIEKSE